MKGRNQNILMLVAVAALIFLLFNMNSKSDYSINEREYSMFAPTAGPAAGPSAAGNTVCGGMNRGTGLASSLLPPGGAQLRTSVSLPQRISSRVKTSSSSCSGWFPETVGGALRNANQQIRKDPPNPKDPFVWNNSTIVPDLMQRGLCA